MDLHTHGDSLLSLYKAHTALAHMMTQVDDLVLKAHKISTGGRQIHGLDVVGFSEFLSDMASSLQEWVPRLEKATMRTEESIVEEQFRKYKDLMSPSLKDKGGGQKIGENVEKNLNDMKTFNAETGACIVEEGKEEDEDNEQEQEQEDWTLSNSPLVPYLDRMQFFMLTPMAKYKKALSEPSRKVSGKAMGTIPYVTAELSQKKCEENMEVMPPIFTSIKDKENISKDLESSSIHGVKKYLPRSSVKCNSIFLENDGRCSDLSSMLLLTPQIRAPLYRQLSADSTISDSPIHLCEEFREWESSVEILPSTPENAKHQACVVENANTPLPPQSLVKRYSNVFLLGNDIVDSSYKQVSSDSIGTIMSSSMPDSVLSLSKSFKESVVETLPMAAFATPTNANQRNYRVKNGTPFPHRSLVKRYSNLFGYGGKTADSICGETPTPMESTVSSTIPGSTLYLGKALEQKTSEAPIAATPIHVKHQESMSDNATPLPPQSLVKRYSNFFGSNDNLEDSSPNSLCSSIVNENEDSENQSVILKDEKENKEEETDFHTLPSPLEQCLQHRTSDTMDVATPLPPQSLMKRYSRFLCEDEDSSDSAIPLTPMLAISPPKTCVFMRPNQINDTLNLEQRLTRDDPVLLMLKSPFQTPAPVGEKALDHASYEDMDLTNLKKPNQHLQRPLETTRGITPSSDMQVLTIKKPHPIKRTPLVELQFSTMKKPGVPLPGEQTLKRELWSKMEAEFCNMENVCKSLFTEALPPPPPPQPKDATIARSNVENRKPNSKVNTIAVKPTVGRRFVARGPQRRQVSMKKPL